MHILFVCTGNTCRSPMAEALMKNEYPYVSVSSAGLFSPFPSPASKNAIAVMKKHGLDISNHRSKQITDVLMDNADLVLTMTNGHKNTLLSIFPGDINKVFTLSEYVGKEEDIDDPFGGDESIYQKCAESILSLIKEMQI